MRTTFIDKFILLLIASDFMAFEAYDIEEVTERVIEALNEPLGEFYSGALNAGKMTFDLTFDELHEMVRTIKHEVLQQSES